MDHHKYLESGTSFVGIELKKPQYNKGMIETCPLCKGHGGWNLRINAYGDGKHFNAACSNCNGWGYIKPEDACKVAPYHQWEVIRNAGNCLNVWKCIHCGIEMVVDSSD